MAIAAAVPYIMAAAGAALAAQQAAEQNKAARRSAESATRAAAEQNKQLAQRASLERQKNINQSEQIMGRLRVSSADAGIGMGGTTSALTEQAAYDAALNDLIIRRNTQNDMARVLSGLDAQVTSLKGSVHNPLIAGFAGGLQGYTAGRGISTGLSGLGSGSSIPAATNTGAVVPDPVTPYGTGLA